MIIKKFWSAMNCRTFGVLVLFAAFTSGCSNTAVGPSADIQETAQQIGDVMASVDEASGNNGGEYAMRDQLDGLRKSFSRFTERGYEPVFSSGRFLASAIPSAEATSCLVTGGFDTCSAGVITRTFNSCTVGTATFSGTVILRWSNGSTCQMGAVGQNVTRTPNFTVTGRRGSTLKVSKTGITGQTITSTLGVSPSTSREFTFASDGINRKFTNGSGAVTFDQTTSTVEPITIRGTQRTARTMNGGQLKVTNNLSGVSCNYTPTAVLWTSGCNCPSSGTWSGSCTDGKNTSLSITGCGTGSITIGSESEEFSFDRCGT